MNPLDFQDSPAGRVIRTGQGKAEYWAFVPNPLPPPLLGNWTLTGELSKADRALSELAGLGRTLVNPDLFISPFLRREAVLSSRIEGTKSDIQDLYLYEAGQLPLPGLEPSGPTEADLREVFNYVVALKFGIQRLDILPVSLRLIAEIHHVLLQDVRGGQSYPGEYRTRQNWIGGVTINDAVYVPPPVPEMKIALDSFEKYLHEEDIYPPLIRLAFIHYQFEAIHPFVDGNGRIGRLLLSLLLVNWGLLPIPLLYLSAYIERHRQVYYDLLLAISQRGTWQEWVMFFLNGITSQAEDAVERVKRIQDLQIAWRSQLQHERATGLTLSAVELLFEHPIITANRIVERCGVSHQAAMKALHRLEQFGIVQLMPGRKRNRLFFAPEIVEIIQ